MSFSDSSWQDCPDTGRSTGAYIIYYQGGPIDHSTNVPGPVAQSSAESEYNAACTAGMALAHFIMLVHELLNVHYRSYIGSLIYLFSTRVDLSFAVHKLEKFSANPSKVHF